MKAKKNTYGSPNTKDEDFQFLIKTKFKLGRNDKNK